MHFIDQKENVTLNILNITCTSFRYNKTYAPKANKNIACCVNQPMGKE